LGLSLKRANAVDGAPSKKSAKKKVSSEVAPEMASLSALLDEDEEQSEE